MNLSTRAFSSRKYRTAQMSRGRRSGLLMSFLPCKRMLSALLTHSVFEAVPDPSTFSFASMDSRDCRQILAFLGLFGLLN